jgi:hypothetical protein
MAGKIFASQAATTIAATQTAEAKKKRKRTKSTVLVDMTTVNSDVETIDVDEEGDVESPSATAAPSTGTPRSSVMGETSNGGAPPDCDDSRAPQVECRHGG